MKNDLIKLLKELIQNWEKEKLRHIEDSERLEKLIEQMKKAIKEIE